MTKLTIELDDNEHKKLKIICASNGVKLKDYVLEVLEKQIQKDFQQLDFLNDD